MSYIPKGKTKEEHLADFQYMKAMLKRNLLKGRYTMSFKKDELESLISACTIAENVTSGNI